MSSARDALWKVLAAWEAPFSLRVAQARRPTLTGLMVAITWSGTVLIWLPGALALAWLRMRPPGLVPQAGVLLEGFFAALLSLLLGQLLKPLLGRPRPFQAEPRLRPLGPLPRDASLPSTHASAAVALAVSLALAGHPWWPFVAGWAALILFSRLYLGVHYPSDLLAGGLLGALCGCADLGPLADALLPL